MPLSSSYKVFPAEELRRFTVDCFTKAGVPKNEAETVADHLVLANLRGVDSHGVIRIQFYLEGIERGLVKPKTDIRVVRESFSTALIDGGGGLGIPVAVKATELAVEKAKSSGIGVVGARNLGHVGMLAYYTIKIAKNRLLGFACANCPAIVAPWGGRERIFGTNPLSLGFPIDENKSIIMDMATSAMASFKIFLAKREGRKIPPDAALDKDGRPTTDPARALEGVLLPFGGHKGYAFSLAVEILSSALLGASLSKEIPLHASTQGGFLVTALNPTLFRETYEDYRRDILKIVETIKKSKPVEGVREVLLPGEPEEETFRKRLRDGVPLDPETWSKMLEVAEKLGVKPPQSIS